MTNQPTFITIAPDDAIIIHTTTFCPALPGLEVHAHILAPLPWCN